MDRDVLEDPIREDPGPNVGDLAAHWWALVVRGLAAVLFGVLTLVAPGLTLFALVILFGLYALVDGVFALTLAARATRAGRSWGWLLFAGVASVVAGVVTFLWPGLTAMALLFVIALWAVLVGIAQVAAAVRLRSLMRHEWLLTASGVLSIALGLLLYILPSTGVLALAWLIGIYAILFGALLVALGFKLHAPHRRDQRRHPTGGVPTPV